ncbi:MAG: hypothetical protein EZS28_042167 [Streblomastix strix]|uniref:Uncharacterized protein n=1 Tax=Streblomastix strix TaxID=222440 RepID=A0A5J4TUX5_9EUKA|nr:MAG: hypothetical protein EZS28_042167 [Streblomastix strix]
MHSIRSNKDKVKYVILYEILQVDEENRKSILIQQGIDPDGEEGRRIFNEGRLMRKKSGFLTRGFYGQSTIQKLHYVQDNVLKGEAETQGPQIRLSKNLKNCELIMTHVKNQVTVQPI